MLSVIIVNYNSFSLVNDSLASIRRFNPEKEFEFIVVNNSLDDSSQFKELADQVILHQMPYNAGFSRANNTGMKLASGDAFLLLNPDTLAIDDSVSRCYNRLMASRFAAAGVQLLNEQQEPQISGNFFVKGGLNHLLPIPYWGGLVRWLGYRTGSKIPNVKEAVSEEPVDWISGAFLMVKRKAVEQAGPMDEDFFLYAEEVEWCSRLGQAGPLCIFGDLHMIHLEGASINKDQQLEEKGYYNLYDRKGLQLMVSNHLRVRKQYGVAWFLFLLLNYTWGVFFFFLSAGIFSLFKLRSPLPEWRKVRAFGKNVARLWSLAPRIISGQPYFYKMF